MKVLVTGGCGYIGAWLVPFLLADGHTVTVVDPQFFGDGDPSNNSNLTVIAEDGRDRFSWEPHDAVIHLASISNNDMYARLPATTANTNRWLPKVECDRFIYASSVAAYGTSDLVLGESYYLCPTTPYGEDKALCERKVLGDGGVAVRAASVCGHSPNMRFDTTVNRMVRDALFTGTIKVNGGAQKRCHVHMQDICDFYRLLLTAPKYKIAGQAFNVVAETDTVMETAMLVARTLGTKPKIDVGPSTDTRSYAVSGIKAREVLGFIPKKRVENAIIDMKARYDSGHYKDAMTNPHRTRML